jgi:hypothetical protein
MSGENLGGCKVTEYCVGGADEMRARDGERDTLSCGPGSDHAIVDRLDVAFAGSNDCDRVDNTAAAEPTAAQVCRQVAPRASRPVCIRLSKALARCEARGQLHGRSPCMKSALRRATTDCRRLRGRRNRSACRRWVAGARKRAGATRFGA